MDSAPPWTAIWDCPECNTTVIGHFDSLKEHIKDEHPLYTLYEDAETGEKTVEKAHSDYLSKRINAEMVVSGCADAKSTDDGDNCAGKNGGCDS